MSLTRAFEEHEITPDLRRVFTDVKHSFDLPFVPTVIKIVAGAPDYLKRMWDDLGPVVRSREFQAASFALEEFTRSQAVAAGWRFPDQSRALAAQKFSNTDVEILSEIVTTFSRALPRLVLFTRLMQRGYQGGQRGRVTANKQASALARLMTLHVPNERDAGLRTWLLYSDMKRTTGAAHVPSVFRVLSLYPGYLGFVWMDSKKILPDPSLQRAREEVNRRALSLLAGLPVRNHHEFRNVTPAEWRDIEETVDGFVRNLPQFALLTAAWQRSFPQVRNLAGAA